MDQPASISSMPRAKAINSQGFPLKEPGLQETATWIDQYLRACGIGISPRRYDLHRRILTDISDNPPSQKLNSDNVADLQRRIDRLLLTDTGESGSIPDDTHGIGRLLSDEKDRSIVTHDAWGIAVPRMVPAPMPSQVVHDDHSAWNAIPTWPFVSARRLAAGLAGAVALIFGGR